MDIYSAAERMMGMGEADWRRHANPLSVWTRFSCLPLLALAVFSRGWIGWWAVPAFACAALWTWINPRAFAPPDDFGSWAARGTLGERVFLARDRHAIPAHHITAAHVLTALSVAGLVPLVWGLWVLDPAATILGVIAVALPKVWFVDRMVWLHADMTGLPPGAPLPEPLLPQERTTP